MLFLVFYFILCAVMVFQGLHLASEVRDPLGVLPAEVAQAPESSRAWGGLLMGFGGLAAVFGLAGFADPTLAAGRPVFFLIGCIFLALFGLWVIFLGRQAEFMGKPTVTDDHGHH